MSEGHVITVGAVRIGDRHDDDIVLTGIRGLGKPETAAGDRDRPREDGMWFGRDRVAGRVVHLTGEVNTGDAASARNVWRKLSAAWDLPEVRQVSGAVATMTISLYGGDPVTVFGRPRALDPLDDDGLNQMSQGIVRWVATFQCIDHLFYGPEQTETVRIVPPTVSGFTWPITWPLTWSLDPVPRHGEAAVDGDAGAYLQATIHAPGGMSRPVIDVDGQWLLEFDTGIAPGHFLTVVASPWARSVSRNGLTQAADTLTSRSRLLKNARLRPGLNRVALRGSDPTGRAYMDLTWRNASRSI